MDIVPSIKSVCKRSDNSRYCVFVDLFAFVCPSSVCRSKEHANFANI